MGPIEASSHILSHRTEESIDPTVLVRIIVFSVTAGLPGVCVTHL